MAAGPMIEFTGVRFTYGPDGPDPFSLLIDDLVLKRGEVAACIGPSGSGKTTLLHLIAGVLLPEAGTIRVMGRDMTGLGEPDRRAMRLERIGMVFQEFELLEYVTARENVLLLARLDARVDRASLERRAHELTVSAGINHVLDRKPRRLSQGERQRVALCRALAPGPELILCDEPTGNLDPESTLLVLDLLVTQARSSGATLLTVTHNHALLDRFDRVLDMTGISRIEAPARPPAGVRS